MFFLALSIRMHFIGFKVLQLWVTVDFHQKNKCLHYDLATFQSFLLPVFTYNVVNKLI